MVDVSVLVKIRDGLVDKSIVVVSENPILDRINLIEALSDQIILRLDEKGEKDGL